MWRGFRIVLCKLFGLHEWVQAEALCTDGPRQFTACLYCRKELKTEEEQYKEKLRHKFRLDATKRREAEMNAEIVAFAMEMSEKYDVLLEIKIKPMRFKGGSYEHKE